MAAKKRFYKVVKLLFNDSRVDSQAQYNQAIIWTW